MTIITIPADATTILRSALLLELGTPVEALAEASMAAEREKHPEWFMEPLAEIDRFRATLDALGWGEPQQPRSARLDLDAHRWAMACALKAQLEVEHSYMKSDDEKEREIASRNARVIEEFVAFHRLAEDA